MLRRKYLLSLIAGLLLIPLTAAGCGSNGSEAGGDTELTVSAAASLETALTEYAESMPEIEFKQTFAGSDLLATQVRQGASPDLYAAADTVLPEQLYREELVEKPAVFASNRLVIAVPADSQIEGLRDLSRPGIKLLLGQSSVPIGSYADQVLADLPDSEREAILANVVSREPDVSSISAKMVQGAADASILYRTDVTAVGEDLKAVPLPDNLQPEIGYGAAVVKGADDPHAARGYLDGLLSGAGKEALRNAGFMPPP